MILRKARVPEAPKVTTELSISCMGRWLCPCGSLDFVYLTQVNFFRALKWNDGLCRFSRWVPCWLSPQIFQKRALSDKRPSLFWAFIRIKTVQTNIFFAVNNHSDNDSLCGKQFAKKTKKNATHIIIPATSNKKCWRKYTWTECQRTHTIIRWWSNLDVFHWVCISWSCSCSPKNWAAAKRWSWVWSKQAHILSILVKPVLWKYLHCNYKLLSFYLVNVSG